MPLSPSNNLTLTCVSKKTSRAPAYQPIMSSTPTNNKEFIVLFPLWRQHSLAARTDAIGPGSSWGFREIETFQVLRANPSPVYPDWLLTYTHEATVRVHESTHMQNMLRLFRTNWRSLNHEKLTESAGPFASFATLLSQVLETAPQTRRGD
jgi:hypothetical protein